MKLVLNVSRYNMLKVEISLFDCVGDLESGRTMMVGNSDSLTSFNVRKYALGA